MVHVMVMLGGQLDYLWNQNPKMKGTPVKDFCHNFK